jgi:hypothetical protein
MPSLSIKKSAFRLYRFSSLVAAVFLVLVPLSGEAQQQQQQQAGLAPFLDVVVVQVKAGQGPEFEELVKKFAAAARKANLPPVQIFEVVRGTQGVYHIVTPMQALAQMDNPPPPPLKPEDMANLFNRLLPTLASGHSFVARTYPQFSILPSAPPAPASSLAVLITTRVVAGRQAEYLKWVGSDLVPAIKKAKVPSYVMSGGFLGDSDQNFYGVVPVANWAAFDGPNPLVAAMGQAAFDKMFDKLDGIVESGELTLLRPRPDLANPTP